MHSYLLCIKKSWKNNQENYNNGYILQRKESGVIKNVDEEKKWEKF